VESDDRIGVRTTAAAAATPLLPIAVSAAPVCSSGSSPTPPS